MNEKWTDIAFRVVLAGLLIISLFPFYWMVMNSLKSQGEIFSNPLGLPGAFRFENYLRAWTKANLPVAFANSLFVAAMTVLIVVVCAAPAAYALSRLRFAGQAFFLTVFVSGLIVAPESVLIPLFNAYSELGLINSPWSIILTHAAFGLPLAVFLFWGFFRDLPKELQEAARIDGCSDWSFFTRIVLPLSKPVLGSVIIFTSLASWNEYLFALTFLRDNASKTLPVRLQVFFGQFATNWPLLFAALVMATFPIILLYLFMQRSFVRGLTAGAVKG
jgi:raffinose/stachyose/melibiose transport system permease protein